jgi:uncharacterized membrane protein YeaQ/YmgE (transglycosylase-associated protein family)
LRVNGRANGSKREHDGSSPIPTEIPINSYIWCAVGALIGWLSVFLMKRDGRGALIENILVGVFGAFLGGDFLVSVMNKGVVNDKDFHIGSLGLAVAGAVAMVVVLGVMRGKVGQIKVSKNKQRDH